MTARFARGRYLATLSRRNNLKNSITYVWMCGFQTILALVVSSASSNTMAGNSNPASWSGDKCLIVTAGGSLLCYGAFLLWEHHRDYRRLRQAEEGATAEEGRGPLEAMSERLLKSCASAFPGADTVVVAEAQPLDETGVRRKLHEMQMRGCAHSPGATRARARARTGGDARACFRKPASRVLSRAQTPWQPARARVPGQHRRSDALRADAHGQPLYLVSAAARRDTRVHRYCDLRAGAYALLAGQCAGARRARSCVC